MTDNKMGWVDQQEERIAEERSKGYFNIEEGAQTFVLLTHCAPLAQVYDKSANKYRPAVEGDKNVSIKGVCWVLQDDAIKQAKLPYTVVKAIKGLSDNPDWEFVLPFPHTLTLSAKNAGTKEVEYSLTPSPKKIEIPKEVLDELAKKPTPEDIIEKIKGAKDEEQKTDEPVQEGIDPKDIPF